MFRALEKTYTTGALVLLLFVFPSFIRAQDSIRPPSSIHPPFDVNEVVGEVSKNHKEGPKTSDEFLLDTSIVGIPAPYGQRQPAVAFDGTNYLVVWEVFLSVSELDIFGARVTPSGRVLDPTGIAIATEPSCQECPSIAYDGTNYLVVWMDSRPGSLSNDIYCARVSRQGVVLDARGIMVSGAAKGQWLPAVAFDGTNYFVAWQDARNNPWVIYGARVTQTGSVVDTCSATLLSRHFSWS